jgi:hypothetical protein
MINPSTIEALKARINTYDIVSEYVSLKKEGTDYVGLCPFHNEKTPSFKVSPSKNIYKCFGCGVSGDAIQFVKERKRISFSDAVKELCHKYNIEVEETMNDSRKTYDKPTPRLQKVSDKAAAWFEFRGISNNTLLRFGVTSSTEWMPQVKKEMNVICFNYYKKDDLVNIKFRDGAKNFKLSKNSELIFYNLNSIYDSDEAIITEGECFHPSAQILTEDKGWVSFKDYNNEKVAQYNEDGSISFVKPLQIIKKEFNGDLIEFSNGQRYYSLTTPDHNIVFNFNGKIIKKKAIQIPSDNKYNIPRVASHNGGGIDLTDNQIRFAIAVSADFCFKGGGYLYCALKRQRKVDRLKELLESLNIKYSFKKDIRGYQNFFIKKSLVPDYVFKLFPMDWISKSTQKQKELIINEMLYWDGNSVPNRHQIEYSSKEIHNATFIQTISSLCGYCSTIIKRSNRLGTWYKVSVLFKKVSTSSQLLLKNSKSIYYNGYVHCLTVESGMLLVRQNNCISVSGNCDALTFHECNEYSVVSVPNGANVNGNVKLEYLDNCYEYFEDKKRIYICTDNDDAGRRLCEELSRRLGKERCYIAEYPKDCVVPIRDEKGNLIKYRPCKDPNEVLVHLGKDAVKALKNNAKLYPLEGESTMDDIKPLLADYYLNGYPKGANSGMLDFIGDSDGYLTFIPQQLTVVTGINFAGKDEVVNNICVGLARNNDWKTAICQFEENTEITASKILEKVVGKAFDFRKDSSKRMTIDDFENATSFVSQYFKFINVDSIDTKIDSVLEKAKEMIFRYGINVLVLSPYNCFEHDVPIGMPETNYVSLFLSKITSFAKKYNVHIFLVAHPTKMQKNQQGKYEVPTLQNISGSVHFANKAHNGLSIYRNFDTGITEVHIQKAKFYWLGQVGLRQFMFDTQTRQYKSIDIKDTTSNFVPMPTSNYIDNKLFLDNEEVEPF